MARKGKQATIGSTFERIRYEHPAPHVARVVLTKQAAAQEAR